MPEGVIAGGWAYVIAAYSVTVVLLVGYCMSLISKLKRGRSEEAGS